MKSRLSLFALLAMTVALVPATHAGPAQPPDASSIQQEMMALIAFLDSPAYARSVSWAEHILLVYELVQGREPTPLEFHLLGALRADIGFQRSDALSVALRGPEPFPSWDQCREFLARVDFSHFRPGPAVTRAAQRLAAVPRAEVLATVRETASRASRPGPAPAPQAEPPQPGVEYNTYFGFLHAHSELSDGEGSALEAYTYARDVGGLDFFSLADHGELLMIWPWERKWEELVAAAEATYQPGAYATLWGFEWSNPILGHVTVTNSSDYTNCILEFWMNSLYDWIAARPESFARYNHPGEYDDLFIEFMHLRRYDPAVPQMVGIENWNKSDSFDQFYYDGSWFSDYSYWDVGNRKGWYLGSLGAQDNHSPDWGTRNDFRTAVLAESLTREAIADAYRNRRFYATEDKDLFFDLRCQGYPMGSRLSGVPRLFVVNACDGSGDTFQQARLYRNGDLLETKAVSGTCFTTFFTDPGASGSDYYYVIVRQNDDNDANGRNDEAISSPIWID
jgi:hypothetical protein